MINGDAPASQALADLTREAREAYDLVDQLDQVQMRLRHTKRRLTEDGVPDSTIEGALDAAADTPERKAAQTQLEWILNASREARLAGLGAEGELRTA